LQAINLKFYLPTYETLVHVRGPTNTSKNTREQNAGARAFKVGEPNLKVGLPKFLVDFNPEKACRA